LLGDQAWGVLPRWHGQTLGELFHAHSGEQVVSTGDGFFIAFDDSEHAVACAIAIQRRLAEHQAASGFAPGVRIGLHTTEATEENRNYHGRGVNEAARISALAGGGEILASSSTAGAHARAGSARTVTLKGIAEPVEIVDIGSE
jgi:class 3 adenylate cyclase